MSHHISNQVALAREAYDQRLGGYLTDSSYLRRHAEPGVIDLAFGDPHEYPSPGLVSLLQHNLAPQHEGWFAYVRNHPPAQAAIACSLRRDLGMPFVDEDIALTNGAFAGLMVCLRSICDPGDEVIYLNPAWFYYEPMIASVGASPKPVDVVAGSWELDLDLIEAAISPATSAIIINTPNNPTGVIYTEAQLQSLAELLSAASVRHGRPIYLLADEAYRRIVFDGRACPSPAQFYPYTFLIHTYTKTLLLPGERVGYIAIPPTMPDRPTARETLTVAQLMTGWAFPNNSLAFAIPQLEEYAVPMAPLQRRRDRAVEALRAAGYTVSPSHGTFYLMAQTPTADDRAHSDLLEDHGVHVLPGSVMGAPGFIRVSLTVSDEMLEQALTRLAQAYRPVRALVSPSTLTREAACRP